MNGLNRRDFLKVAGAAATALPGLPSVLAQDAGRGTKAVSDVRTLVTIYLRGGMDALNAVVPFGDKRYYEIRPTIAIPAADGDEGPGVIKLDDTFGLHPSMKALRKWWDAKRFAAVVNAGSPHTTRSHFDAQDFMEYAAPGLRTVKAGWLNRYLEGSKARVKSDGPQLRALAMQGLLPRALRGPCPVLAVPDRSVLNNEKVLDTFEDVYGSGGGMEGPRSDDDPVVQAGRETLETLKRYKEIIGSAKKGERKGNYPGGLGDKLRDIASVVRADAGLEVACVDVGGWDHHAQEGSNAGTISRMLENLSQSLDAFAEDLGPYLDSTLVLVITEFGRTCRENGNNGTDHGHGGCMLMLGGGLKGGQIHGKWTGLDDKALYQSRDLPVTTDFRDVFADVLRHHMKWEPAKEFFPDYKAGTVKGLFA